MTFLGWFDPDKKTPVERKLSDAVVRYVEKHDTLPTLALVNPEQFPDIEVAPEGLTIRPAQHVAANTFFVGTDEDGVWA